MTLSRPEIKKKDQELIISAAVNSSKGKLRLWFSIDKSFEHFISLDSDAFLVALLIPAMAADEDIRIKGILSEKLFLQLDSIQLILKTVIPTLNQIKIYSEEINKSYPIIHGVSTGFSGGIDSFSLLCDYYYSDISSNFKISHLIFNNVGSGGGSISLNLKRYTRLLPVTKNMGLPLIRIDSNLFDIYLLFKNEILSDLSVGMFQQTHTLRNAAATLILQNGISKYLYATGVDYSKVFVGPSHAIGFSDPVLLPLLSTNNLECISVGGQYSRIEKTLKVAKLPISFDVLDVCIQDSEQFVNCSYCWKCMRTMLTLDIAGYLHCFKATFDIDRYHRHKEKYLANLKNDTDPLAKEVLQFALESKFKN